MVNGLDYFENKIVFLIKGKAVSLQCNFYCMVSFVLSNEFKESTIIMFKTSNI